MKTVAIPTERLSTFPGNMSYTCTFSPNSPSLGIYPKGILGKYMNGCVYYGMNCSTLQLQDWKSPICPSVGDCLNTCDAFALRSIVRRNEAHLCKPPECDVQEVLGIQGRMEKSMLTLIQRKKEIQISRHL